MRFLRKLLAKTRVRAARKRLAWDPSPRAYAELAQQYALLGMTRDVLRVCREGQAAFPGNSHLARLAQRALRVDREDRMAQLKRELSEAPRPALWNDMCELLIESGWLARAEETAGQWIESNDAPEARLMLARVRVERFLADRGRDQGIAALAALDECEQNMANDAPPLELRLKFLLKIGAWRDARQCTSRLLQLNPGSSELESRYRSLEALEDDSPSIERALLQVERTGALAEEEARPSHGGVRVRPILRDLAADPAVHAAMYVRGSTVLIQGPRGATAERIARGVRTILASGRGTARKLGLGQIFHVVLEGGFGTLSIAPGELDAGAIWSQGALKRRREETLMSLAGINADLGEGEAAA